MCVFKVCDVCVLACSIRVCVLWVVWCMYVCGGLLINILLFLKK